MTSFILRDPLGQVSGKLPVFGGISPLESDPDWLKPTDMQDLSTRNGRSSEESRPRRR